MKKLINAAKKFYNNHKTPVTILAIIIPLNCSLASIAVALYFLTTEQIESIFKFIMMLPSLITLVVLYNLVVRPWTIIGWGLGIMIGAGIIGFGLGLLLHSTNPDE